MGFISRLFGSQKAPPPSSGFAPVSSQFGVALDSKMPETNTSDLTRRELVRVALRDMCRAHGVPAAWIECEALAIHSRNGESRMFVRLKVLHWDERLMKYALAFQRHLRSEVVRLDPRAADWLMGIGWDLVSEANCPYLTMPRPATWMAASPVANASSPAAAPHAAPVDVLDRRSRPRDGDISQRKPVIPSPVTHNAVVPRPVTRKPTPKDEDFPETRQAEL